MSTLDTRLVAFAQAVKAKIALANWLPSYGSYGAFFVSLGYGTGPATIRIGANTLDGRGVLQGGGAGPKDGGNGSYYGQLGHPNWNVIQSSIPFNPTEWNIQGNGIGGVAVSDGSTTLVRSTGSAWTSAMVGQFLWFNGIAYTVSSFTNSSTLVLSSAPAAGTATWQYVYTTGSGTCTVASGVVSRVKGDPFIPNTFGSGFAFTLNGTGYTVSTSSGPDSCTVTSPPADGNYTYSYRTNINNQAVTLRLELTAGTDEENLSFYGTPFAYYLDSQSSGNGKRRSLFVTSQGQVVADFAPVGKFVELGGPQNTGAARFLWVSSAVNRFDVLGAVTGSSPLFRAAGSDSNVGVGVQVKGTGDVRIIDSSGTTQFIFNPASKVMTLPTLTVATLPTAGTAGRRAFVTDANATTFASTVASGGTNKVPVYDDGTAWRIG